MLKFIWTGPVVKSTSITYPVIYNLLDILLQLFVIYEVTFRFIVLDSYAFRIKNTGCLRRTVRIFKYLGVQVGIPTHDGNKAHAHTLAYLTCYRADTHQDPNSRSHYINIGHHWNLHRYILYVFDYE